MRKRGHSSRLNFAVDQPIISVMDNHLNRPRRRGRQSSTPKLSPTPEMYARDMDEVRNLADKHLDARQVMLDHRKAGTKPTRTEAGAFWDTMLDGLLIAQSVGKPFKIPDAERERWAVGETPVYMLAKSRFREVIHCGRCGGFCKERRSECIGCSRAYCDNCIDEHIVYCKRIMIKKRFASAADPAPPT